MAAESGDRLGDDRQADRNRRQERQTQQPREHQREDFRKDFRQEPIPDRWEERDELPAEWEELLPRKQLPKVRKPVQISQWFGFKSETDTSDTDDGEWLEVDKKKRKEEKKKLARRKKKELEILNSTKASCMVGIGPFNDELMDDLRCRRVNFEEAEVIVAKDFLKNRLNFENFELDKINIMETKLSTKKDDIIYLALESQDQ